MPALLKVWKCTSPYGALEQQIYKPDGVFFQGRPCIFHQDNAKAHTAAITAAWLCRRRVQELTYLQSRHFTNCKHLAHDEIRKTASSIQDCWVPKVLHQTTCKGCYMMASTIFHSCHFKLVFRKGLWFGLKTHSVKGTNNGHLAIFQPFLS